MEKLIRFCVLNPLITIIVTLFVALGGWITFQSLPIDAVPDITNTQVQINTLVDGLAPEEIERSITFPVESAMGGITGVSQVRSITRFGLSQVTVAFDDGVDIYRARQQVSERLLSVSDDLPPGAKPNLGPVSSGLGEIFHYALEAEEVKSGEERKQQLMDLKALQEWFVRPRLLTVKGVAEVNTSGGFERQFHIQPIPERLRQYGLHLEDIIEAVEKNNKNVGGGYIQQTAEQFLVQGVGLMRSLEDIEKTPIKNLENLRTITLGEVANVKLDSSLRTGASLIRGEEGIIGSAFMTMGENSRTVSKRVGDRVKEIQKDLPKGYKIEVLYDRSELVNATLATIEHNLLTGAALVILFLLLLVGNIRAAIITAITIPITLLIAFVFMKFFAISGNLMSLGALDFGIIVDGVVIVLDQCVRLLKTKSESLGRTLNRREIQDTVIEATIAMRKAAGFGQIIIVVVFLPLLALTGIEGKMFVPMAATFCFALIIAFVLSFATAPAMAGLLLEGKPGAKTPFLMRLFEKLYVPSLARALKFRKIVIGIGVFAILIGVFLFTRLGGEFLPQLNEGSFAFQVVRPVNISIDQSVELQAATEKVLMSFPEVDVAFSRIGTAEVATDPMGVNLADTYITLKPRDQWPLHDGKRFSKNELGEKMLAALYETVPGQRVLVTQPIQMRFNELLEGTRADVSLKVFGDDLGKLEEITEQIAAVVRAVPGSGDVETEVKGTSPLLRIEPKYDVLKRLGIAKSEVLDTVEASLGGREVGFLFEGVRRFPIVVRLSETLRSDLEAIKKLPIGVGPSQTLPLEAVATLSFKDTYGSVTREMTKRRAAVLINPRGRDTESFVEEAQLKVAEKIKLPEGYFLEWGGNFKNLASAKERLSWLAPLALLLVLMMIYAAFRSVLQTLLVFSCVPLALVGGVLGLMIRGLPFSISAGVGFIALSGIAVLNAVILIGHFNELKLKGMTGDDLVKQGALARLRPVLMTALVDVFGFLPMMLATGVGAEVQAPLATVVIGGIVSSTLLTLIVLPALYRVFESRMNVSEGGFSHG